jgi:hypothetical protein
LKTCTGDPSRGISIRNRVAPIRVLAPSESPARPLPHLAAPGPVRGGRQARSLPERIGLERGAGAAAALLRLGGGGGPGPGSPPALPSHADPIWPGSPSVGEIRGAEGADDRLQLSLMRGPGSIGPGRAVLSRRGERAPGGAGGRSARRFFPRGRRAAARPRQARHGRGGTQPRGEAGGSLHPEVTSKAFDPAKGSSHHELGPGEP